MTQKVNFLHMNLRHTHDDASKTETNADKPHNIHTVDILYTKTSAPWIQVWDCLPICQTSCHLKTLEI